MTLIRIRHSGLDRGQGKVNKGEGFGDICPGFIRLLLAGWPRSVENKEYQFPRAQVSSEVNYFNLIKEFNNTEIANITC